jgi:adenosine 3'-phospho 5'-phosphosulfate transporter B2
MQSNTENSSSQNDGTWSSFLYTDGARRSAWCVFLGGGIIGTLAVYGVIQQRIMQQPFGGVMFSVSAFLVLCNRIVNTCFATSMIAINGEPMSNTAPLWKYLIISASNVAASMCQYSALEYVSFPVQMLGKSFKMMPVMIWGLIISGKSYTWQDWLVAAAITGGVTEFLLTGPISSSTSQGTTWEGLVLLVCFLAFDGLTSTMQEKLFKEYKTTKYNQMFYVNLASIVVSIIIVSAQQKWGYCFSFIGAHGYFMPQVLLLSGAAASSQWFIYTMIKDFGALVFAAAMNVRQVISIIISYIDYNTSITGLQVLGLGVVFSALFYKSYQGLKAKKAAKTDETTPMIRRNLKGIYKV